MGIFFIEYVLVAFLGNNSPIILNEHRYQSAFHCALDVQALENYGTTGGQEDLELYLEGSSIELTNTIHDFESYFEYDFDV